MAEAYPPGRPLRLMVLAATGQDLRKCSHCATCSGRLEPDMDLTLESLVQLALLNDDEALTSRPRWSERAREGAEHACASGLDLPLVIRVLRVEAVRRGLAPDGKTP